MVRIGIIGTENSHAMAFAKYFNLPDAATGKMHYDDMRVVAVMGDPDSTAAIVKETGAAFVAEKAEDFFGRVDAVMITSRKGSVHSQFAMPFVEKGMPLFIDKPLTSDLAQARELMEQIEAHGCKVMGGSGCKYVPAIQEIRDKVSALRASGEFMSAAMNFRVMLESVYDGIYFYASHLVEMGLAAFGHDAKALQAVRTGNSLIVTVQYEKDAVSLHFNALCRTYCCTVFGANQNDHFDIDISAAYGLEASYFADMLLGKRDPLPSEVLLKPVQMIDAIERSLATGGMVSLT